MQHLDCEPAPTPTPALDSASDHHTHNQESTSRTSVNMLPVKLKQAVGEKENIQSYNNEKITKEETNTKDDSTKGTERYAKSTSDIENLVKRSSDSEDESREHESNNGQDSDNCSGDTRYVCPMCDIILFSYHDFTIHIHSHSNTLPEDLQVISSPKGFVCKICGKSLTSATSLNRHVLMHSADRPFKCKICNLSFSTSGNMLCHMRSHKGTDSESNYNFDSDGSSDSISSTNTFSPSPTLMNLRRGKPSRTSSEFNNNNVELSPMSIVEAAAKRKSESIDMTTPRKRKCENKKCFSDKLDCSLCNKTGFLSSNLLETHIEESHPDYKAKCDPCNLIFKNHRVLNLHKYMVHHADMKENSFNSKEHETVGFKDLTFVDFSSEKFPHIARVMCEQSWHHANSLYHRFQCTKCTRAFPCGSALSIHRQSCGQENYASSGESCHQDNDLSSSDNDTPTDLSRTNKRSSWSETKVSESSDDIEEERKRCTFFAGLNLQNKSMTSSYQDCSARESLKSTPYFNSMNYEGKDLADIQSIISVASAGSLLHDLSKSPTPTVLEVTPPDSGSRVGMYDSGITDEEQQDCFAAEFRKMKLRGEFPCRLCTAIFPNLRALKGHNRVHLSSNAGQSSIPYRCNMCPHSSSDKSALIRHMRTHNGDRPYECALCHYAFTTKANCERHLRNRHAKMTRDDIKKSIIYHPSEDPTNETDHKPSRDDVKRSLFSEEESLKQSKCVKNDSYNKVIEPKPFDNFNLNVTSPFPYVKKITYSPDVELNERRQRQCLDVGTMTYDDVEPATTNHPDNFSDKSECERDTPLDLSMDVLDLSKKKNVSHLDNNNKLANVKESEPQDLSKKSKLSTDESTLLRTDTNKISDFPLKGLLLNSDAKGTTSKELYEGDGMKHPNPNALHTLDLCKLYAANSQPLCMNNTSTFPTFPTSHGGSFPPFFLPPPPPVLFPNNANHDFVEMKERLQKELIRGLQLNSGGSLVLDQIAMANASERLQVFHQQAIAEFNWRLENTKEDRKEYTPVVGKDHKSSVISEPDDEPRSQETNHSKIPEKVPIVKSKQDSPSSVKMIIKNGVLIPKQKQRRYRTERPFSCEHCSARFTLRSNMERHIKQQHPQFWSQRQRQSGNIINRRNHSLPSKLPQSNHTQYNPHNSMLVFNMKSEDDVSRSSISSDNANYENKLNLVEGKPCISEEVKNAIAQQLKSKNPVASNVIENDNEEYDLVEDKDEDLVIDEEAKDEDGCQNNNVNNLEEEINMRKKNITKDENLDLASVSRLLDNASTQTFRQYFHTDDEPAAGEGSDEDEEGLVAAGSASEGCNSGSDENRSESENNHGGSAVVAKKKSAYSLAPNRVSCPYCFRKFPWSSSLRRHVLTHTGQKPYKCSFCPLLFTTKSNCDRHLLRKHGGGVPPTTPDLPPSVKQDGKSGLNTPSYTMRNVPERPYKCKTCPSSTFSTLSNLRKHLSTKHSEVGGFKNEGAQSGYESQGSMSEDIEVLDNDSCKNDHQESEIIESKSITDLREVHPGHIDNKTSFKPQTNSTEQSFVVTQQPSDLPFKCHLCEGSFSERQEALDHIRDSHCAEFQLLVSKGALEAGVATEDNQVPEEGGEECLEQLRGKFPDYANRKVMCAFCLRRFWSAEDLRRHMRTHTGERPFSCDVCRRRFTLKHSMLRHRKKHSFPNNSMAEETSPASDEDGSTTSHNNNTIAPNKAWAKSRMEEESDLISNLLGIQDKTIVDKMLLSKSADDAAKLLGVQK